MASTDSSSSADNCSDDNISVTSPTIASTMNPIDKNIKESLTSNGYTPIKKIANALQGAVWETTKNNSKFIVKIASKSLYKSHITYINQRRIAIKEDIVQESEIMKYLSVSAPSAMTKFVDFFDDAQYYFLVMEHGGYNFFDFVSKCHEYIAMGFLKTSDWIAFCKIAMKQMVSLIDWMQNSMKCCHLDISLENFVINDLEIEILDIDEAQKHLKLNHDFQIKIIDFGLAEVFQSLDKSEIDFKCNKHVGKQVYQAPEVYAKATTFDARSADVWSLGVSLFMMVIGATPFNRASNEDERFRLVMRGNMISLLHSWHRMSYINADIMDLLEKIFKMEPHRITIQEIRKHSFLSS